MKTAVSVPDELFAQVEALARNTRRSRSEVYSTALREYVARHAPERVTDAVDAVVADVGETGPDLFVDAAARHVLGSVEW